MKKNEPLKFYGIDNPNGFLSNFYDAAFTINGALYKTNEHYYQSKKFEGT